MPLKMTIGPQEWLMLGDTKVMNIHPQQAVFIVDGAGPVLRQAHTLSVEDADTPAKKAYLAVQRLYLGITTDMGEYRDAVAELLRDTPASKEVVLEANIQMISRGAYGALREYRKLL